MLLTVIPAQAMLAVFQVSNKELTHVNEDLRNSPEHARQIEIASRGIPVLMVGCFYKPVGMPAPNYKLTCRPREAPPLLE